MTLPKAFLHRMQLAIACQTLDGGYLRTIRLDSQHCAGFRRLTIQQHRARAANAGFTAHMRAGELAMVA